MDDRRFAAVQWIRILVLTAAVLPLAGISSFDSLFAPKADPWPRWETHEPTSKARIDHAAWDGLLKKYLRTGEDGLARFDYGGVTTADRATLGTYVKGLAGIPIDTFNRNEQLAYWIDLYNALTVQVVLDHYPIASIRDIDISPGLFADGPWDKALVTVYGEDITLNDIEHRILRPIWKDPRIHYAVNCASIGCPNLQDTAFTGDNAEQLLDRAATQYVNSPRGVRVTPDGVIVSSIYVWFAGDFGGDDAGILSHLRHYAEADLAARLDGVKSIADHAYDWRLNDTAAQ